MNEIKSEETKEFINQYLNKAFFNRNVIGQMSAFRILDITTTVNDLDKEIYKQLPEENKRKMDEQNKMAENEEDINKLYNMLRKGLYPSTVFIIANRLLEQKDQMVPKMLEDLKRSGNDNFIEATARILIKSTEDFSKEIAAILTHIKYPYAQAVACYVLGKIGSEEHIETLYNYFNKFKKNYPDETYYEGPLMGLYELKTKYGF